MKLKKPKEANVHQQLVNYLKHQYPGIIFRTDFSSGIRMTIGQAVKHKALQQSRAFPDLTIFYPTVAGHALFLEIKRSKDEVFKKDGSLKKDEHIEEQAAILGKLNFLGYCAKFACGFDEGKAMIDSWLNTNGTTKQFYKTDMTLHKFVHITEPKK